MPKAKIRAAVRDITPHNKPSKNSFSVQHVRLQDGPTVEPLAEDQPESSETDVNFHIERVEPVYTPQPEPVIEQTPEDYSMPESVMETPIPESEISPVMVRNMEESVPKDTIKVKFSKFVTLVANHDFSDVIETNPDEEIIISSNLLTELASGSDRKGEKKIPLVFVIGIAIGVVLTYILFSTGK